MIPRKISTTTALRIELAELEKRGIGTAEAGLHLEIVDDGRSAAAERTRILALIDRHAPAASAELRNAITSGFKASPTMPATFGAAATQTRTVDASAMAQDVYARRAQAARTDSVGDEK